MRRKTLAFRFPALLASPTATGFRGRAFSLLALASLGALGCKDVGGGPEAKRKPRCVTCGVSVESERIWVEFKCPACSKESIIRCEKCKRLENSYTCKSCGFKGP